MTDILCPGNMGQGCRTHRTGIRYGEPEFTPGFTGTPNSYRWRYPLEYQNRRIELSKKHFRIFQYVHGLYQEEGRTAFEYAELSEALTGDECEISYHAFKHAIRALGSCFARLRSPISLFHWKEVLYIGNKDELALYSHRASVYAVQQDKKVYEWYRISQEKFDGKGWYNIARLELEQKQRDGIFPDGFTIKDVDRLSRKIKRRVKAFMKRQNDKQLRFDF